MSSGLYYGEPVDSVAERAAGLDIVPTVSGEVLGATARQTWEDNIGVSALRIGERNARQDGMTLDAFGLPVQGPPREQTILTAEDANKKFKLPGMTPFTSPIPEDVAGDIYEERRQRLIRENTIARRETGIGTGMAAQFATSALVSLLDPINVAAAFIPVIPEAKVAAWLADASGALGRAGVRTGVGAVSGAAGMAMLEPFNYARDAAEHNDWTMSSALMNIALGAAMGGALHPLVGNFTAQERAFRALAPETREAAARVSLAALDEARPVRAAEVVEASQAARAAQELTQRAAQIDKMAADAPRVAEIRTIADDARSVVGPRANRESAPVSLLEFIGQKGGVQEQGGDLIAIGADTHFVPGQGRIVRKSGMTLDYAREAAEEAGYLPPNSTVRDFLDAVAEEVSGRRVYLPHEVAAANDRRMARLSEREQEKVGAIRSEILSLTDDYGIRINDAELEQAMILTMDGMHPEEAIRQATIGSDLRATGFLDEATDGIDSAARIAQSDGINPLSEAFDQELTALRERAPVAEGSVEDQLARATADMDKYDAILKAERDAERLSPTDEANLAAAADRAKLFEGDAKAMEAAGFCSAMRG
jgi:hypothetical protein